MFIFYLTIKTKPNYRKFIFLWHKITTSFIYLASYSCCNKFTAEDNMIITIEVFCILFF